MNSGPNFDEPLREEWYLTPAPRAAFNAHERVNNTVRASGVRDGNRYRYPVLGVGKRTIEGVQWRENRGFGYQQTVKIVEDVDDVLWR